MKLPEDFVKHYLRKGEGMQIFAVPLDELSQDEIKACCIYAFEELNASRKQHARDLDMLAGVG